MPDNRTTTPRDPQHRGHRRGQARDLQQSSSASARRQLSPCPPGLSKENMTAISAPYNFVPLADWVHIPDWSTHVSHDWPFEDGYSGEIHYHLIAESPLLVGGRQEKNTANDRPHTEVRPFQLPDGRYAIPGSSLKGMLRAVVEIAGFGRMRMVDDGRPGLRDISGPHVKDAYTARVRGLVKAGFLRLRDDGGREIIPARMARLPHSALESAFGMTTAFFRKGQSVSEKYRTWCERCRRRGWRAHRVRFNLDGSEAVDIGRGSCEGFPVFTGQISDSRSKKGKRRDFVFYDTDETRPLDVPDDTWRDFLRIHGNEAPAGSDMPWPGYWKRRFRDGERVPVFYLSDGAGLRIGLAYMPKLAGDFGIHDCIRHVAADHLATTPGIGRYDLADLLFGAVNGEEQNDALRGRVSFETAIAEGRPQPRQQPDTILNGPKPTYFPNYIQQKTDESTLYLGGGHAAQYATYVRSPGHPSPQIRGFKRYPARSKQEVGVQALTKDQESNRKVQIRLHPLPAGTSFQGRIVFHNLKREELGALLWALTWGGDEGLRHGLGMGKPFGFGQVRFEIDGRKSRLVPNDPSSGEAPLSDDRQRELTQSFAQYMEAAAEAHGGWENSPQIQNLLAMADPSAAEELPPGMELRHMKLMRCMDSEGKQVSINEFLWARQKTPALVLGDYATVTRWPTGATEKRRRGKKAARLRVEIESKDLHPWLKEQLPTILATRDATDLGALMRHKSLFTAWTKIEDTTLKRKVFTQIQSFWKAKGWWDMPETKSMRNLRDRYQREMARLGE